MHPRLSLQHPADAGRNTVVGDDQPAIRAIVKEGARTNYTFASLVLGVVKSAPFQMRETPGGGTSYLNSGRAR